MSTTPSALELRLLSASCGSRRGGSGARDASGGACKAVPREQVVGDRTSCSLYSRPWRRAAVRVACDMPSYAASSDLCAPRRSLRRWRVREEEETASCRERFDAAVAELRPRLLIYMHQRLRDPHTAADLTQETLLRMLRYRDAPGIQSYPLLMYRIAHNLLLEHWRRRHRGHAADHVSLDLVAPLLADGSSVADIVAARRFLARLSSHTLAMLPPKCRQAFELHRFEGLTYPEVAAAMGISVKMVEKHVSRALAACRRAAE